MPIQEKSSKELLYLIKNALLSDEKYCDVYKSEDIGMLLYTEAADIKQLLDENTLTELFETIEKHEKQLQESLIAHDVTNCITVLDSMIEILSKMPQREVAEKLNYDEAYERHRVEETIVVIGDSHTNFFSGNEYLTFLPLGQGINVAPQVNGFPFTALHLGACLAYNSNMYGSSEGFLEKLDWLMEHFIVKGSKVVVSLGEIDIRCHVFKQTEIQGCSYEKVIDNILENYFDMLLYIQEHGFDVYIWGPIGSQIDKCPVGDYLPKVGGEVERNMATRYFTDRAREKCQQMKIGFSSIFEEMVDENMKTRESFICDDMCHLTQNIYDVAVKEWERAGILR